MHRLNVAERAIATRRSQHPGDAHDPGVAELDEVLCHLITDAMVVGAGVVQIGDLIQIAGHQQHDHAFGPKPANIRPNLHQALSWGGQHHRGDLLVEEAGRDFGQGRLTR